MSHTIRFYAHVGDGGVIVQTTGLVEHYPDNDGSLLHREIVENLSREIVWVDGLDVTLSCLFHKLLSRFMEVSGLEPFSF